MNAEDSGEAVAIAQNDDGAFVDGPLNHDARERGTVMMGMPSWNPLKLGMKERGLGNNNNCQLTLPPDRLTYRPVQPATAGASGEGHVAASLACCAPGRNWSQKQQ